MSGGKILSYFANKVENILLVLALMEHVHISGKEFGSAVRPDFVLLLLMSNDETLASPLVVT